MLALSVTAVTTTGDTSYGGHDVIGVNINQEIGGAQ
jgi:hypothetical protein